MILEIAVASAEDGAAAGAAGADRLELSTGLELGGLTPSSGAIREAVERTGLPVIVMIRPRAGGFIYSAAEYRTMLRDAESALEKGAAGIAFGFLTPEGAADIPRCGETVRLCGGAETVFHRAFDEVPAAESAMERLIDLGVTRVLTSGGARTALEGAPAIARLIEISGGRIGILPAGRIRAENAARVIAATGCGEIHAAPLKSETGPPDVSRGGSASDMLPYSSAPYPVLDAEAVRALRRAVNRHSPD